MDTNEFVREAHWQDRRVSHAARAAISATAKPTDRKRLGCGDVARKRAARYARQHRIPKPLWPLIAAITLVGLIFERQPLPVLSWTGRRPLGDDDGVRQHWGRMEGRTSMGFTVPLTRAARLKAGRNHSIGRRPGSSRRISARSWRS